MLFYGLFAGVVAILATVAIERLGGRMGGLLASVPTTIIPASIGILEQSKSETDFVWAMAIVPFGMLVNAFFLFLWRWVPPRLPAAELGHRLGMMVCVALTGWALAAGLGLGLSSLWKQWAWPPMILGIFVTLSMVVIGVWACLARVPAPPGTRKVSLVMLASRGVLAGCCIVTSIWLSGKGLPLISGIASVFPAIFLTTMIALWLSQGEAVQAGAVGPLMLGSTSVAVYALLATMTLPSWGLVVGSFGAWLGSVALVSVPAHAWLQASPGAGLQDPE